VRFSTEFREVTQKFLATNYVKKISRYWSLLGDILLTSFLRFFFYPRVDDNQECDPFTMTRFTGDSWAPAINVTCWYFMVVSILALITRLGTKLWIYRKLTRDDYLIIAAVVSLVQPPFSSPKRKKEREKERKRGSWLILTDGPNA
jgi:hypothetical protein